MTSSAISIHTYSIPLRSISAYMYGESRSPPSSYVPSLAAYRPVPPIIFSLSSTISVSIPIAAVIASATCMTVSSICDSFISSAPLNHWSTSMIPSYIQSINPGRDFTYHPRCVIIEAVEKQITSNFKRKVEFQMKRIKTLVSRDLAKTAKTGGCGECQTSCQSASKTSCGPARSC